MTTPKPRDNSGDFEDAAEMARRHDDCAQIHMEKDCGCSDPWDCARMLELHQHRAAHYRRLAARGEHPPKF